MTNCPSFFANPHRTGEECCPRHHEPDQQQQPAPASPPWAAFPPHPAAIADAQGSYFDGPVLHDTIKVYSPMKLSGRGGKLITQPCFPKAHHLFTSPLAVDFIIAAIQSTLEVGNGASSTTTASSATMINERLHLTRSQITWCLRRAAQQEGDLATEDVTTLLSEWSSQAVVANTRTDLPKPYDPLLQVLVPKSGGLVREAIWYLVGLINSQRDLRRGMLGSPQLCLGIMEEVAMKTIPAAPICITICLVPSPEVPHPRPSRIAVPTDPHYHGVRIYREGQHQEEYYPDPDLFVALANLLVALDRSWRYPQYSLFKSEPAEDAMDLENDYQPQHPIPAATQPAVNKGLSGGGQQALSNGSLASCDEEEGCADALRELQHRPSQVDDVEMVEAEEGVHSHHQQNEDLL